MFNINSIWHLFIYKDITGIFYDVHITDMSKYPPRNVCPNETASGKLGYWETYVENGQHTVVTRVHRLPEGTNISQFSTLHDKIVKLNS